MKSRSQANQTHRGRLQGLADAADSTGVVQVRQVKAFQSHHRLKGYEMAKLLGIDPGKYSELINGHRRPTMRVLIRAGAIGAIEFESPSILQNTKGDS
jgi:hypothetical protein